MPYLLKSDFDRVITTIDLDKLTDSTDSVWQSAELSALEEIKSYMRYRYDVAIEFDLVAHLQANTYQEGDIVIIQIGNNSGVYRALSDVPANTEITNTTFWIKEDPRNAKLVTTCVIIILYENYARLNGTEIPNWLQLRYDGGDVRQSGGIIGYLKNIQRGVIEPDIPLLADVADQTVQTGNNIVAGTASDVVNRNTAI